MFINYISFLAVEYLFENTERKKKTKHVVAFWLLLWLKDLKSGGGRIAGGARGEERRRAHGVHALGGARGEQLTTLRRLLMLMLMLLVVVLLLRLRLTTEVVVMAFVAFGRQGDEARSIRQAEVLLERLDHHVRYRVLEYVLDERNECRRSLQKDKEIYNSDHHLNRKQQLQHQQQKRYVLMLCLSRRVTPTFRSMTDLLDEELDATWAISS